ncbi:hypothetical protein RJT34_31663 [Clitoria ternatea]|uniref:Zinc finger CCCH domain-containing protein 55-like n=1 Tax=Clitoria ternatea TaxID=43366 RepID=A0AAN9EYW8_CLITE
MDSYEASNVVFSKINNLDPENASKIMGYILVNLEDSELVYLSTSPDYVLHTLVSRVKQHLRSCSAPSFLNSIPRSPTTTNPFSSFTANPSSHAWPLSGFPNNLSSIKSSNIHTGSESKSCLSPCLTTCYNTASNSMDEHQMGGDYFSFLNEKDEGLVDSRLEFGQSAHKCSSLVSNGNNHFHERSYFGHEETEYKSCLYFAKGFCKNGNNCKFMHGALTDSVDAVVASPSEFNEELNQEIIRLKAVQHQRLVASSQVMSGVNFWMQQQKDFQRAATMVMGDEFSKPNQCRMEGNHFLAMVSAEKHNSSRQIYLTFPAESTFKDEDVSEYFSKFGPVQDVRIPYQQKRMFGFVTFVYPETVRLILSKGNPHFICDSRILVKPYKEKGKVLDKRQQHQQQQLERGEFSPCLSPSGLDSKEPSDFHLGARMFYNPHDILLRRKLEEQAELQRAIELQERRLMNLQLPGLKNHHIRHHQHSLSIGGSLPSPKLHSHISNPCLSPDRIKGDITGFSVNPISTVSLAERQQQPLQEIDPARILDTHHENKKDFSEAEIKDLCYSMEQALPDNLFASPTKAARDNLPDFSTFAATSESASFSISLAFPTPNKLESQATSSDMASH